MVHKIYKHEVEHAHLCIDDNGQMICVLISVCVEVIMISF